MFDRLKGLIVAVIAAVFGDTAAAKFVMWAIMRKKIPRPYPFSLWSADTVENYKNPSKPTADEIERARKLGTEVHCADYTSWPGLVDRTFTGRHLKPWNDAPDLAPAATVVKKLFNRSSTNGFIASPRMSVLFTFFAQWFTDSFLRTHPIDRRKNTSNHEIDLCQIYGLTEATTHILRSHKDGKLRTDVIEGEEFPEKLLGSDGRIKEDFKDLPCAKRMGQFLKVADELFGIPVDGRGPFLYASGLDLGNTTIGYTAVSTIFLREHNRLCDELKRKKGWQDDERLFQTARNINICLLLKIIIEDYINGLAGRYSGRFKLVPGYADKQRWYRTNRISIEFDLLYRWHGLIPNSLECLGQRLSHKDYMLNNEFNEIHGVEAVIDAASRQKAGAMVLHNTPEFMEWVEISALDLSRQFDVRPYTEYCDRFGVKRPRSFEELTGDEKLAADLRDVYQNVDQVEFMVGLRAEKRGATDVLGSLMLDMVAFDAFSQALTNPLLSENVFGHETFTKSGFELINETRSFQDIVDRNLGERSKGRSISASFTL